MIWGSIAVEPGVIGWNWRITAWYAMGGIGAVVIWSGIYFVGRRALGAEPIGLGDAHLLAGMGLLLGPRDFLAFFFISPFVGLAIAAIAALRRRQLQQTILTGPMWLWGFILTTLPVTIQWLGPQISVGAGLAMHPFPLLRDSCPQAWMFLPAYSLLMGGLTLGVVVMMPPYVLVWRLVGGASDDPHSTGEGGFILEDMENVLDRRDND